MKNHKLKLSLIVVIMQIANITLGQKQDFIWLQGYLSSYGWDSSSNRYLGTSELDFNYTPRLISYATSQMNFDATNTSYCDANGNLLFYTNGIYVANKWDEVIQNSDSLNAGPLQYWYDTTIQTFGYRIVQGIIALEVPSRLNEYYLLHTYMDTTPQNPGVVIDTLFYSRLDMNANTGHGLMVQKNRALIHGKLGGEVSAVRHANGRDWWVLIQKRNTNCYYELLIDPDGIHVLNDLQCGGVETDSTWTGSVCFSPDGSKFVYLGGNSGVNIFNFDRCSGQLSNPVNIPLPVIIDSGWYGYSVAISPNSRFLYVAVTLQVYQYDLSAMDIPGSIDTVAFYDGYKDPFGSYFSVLQLGPDGEIYSSCGNTETDYHAILHPNEKGDSCLFKQHSIHLPSFCACVPNFPNYRLGKLLGSTCDTLVGLNDEANVEKDKMLRVFPNPASDKVTVDYGNMDWNKGDVNLELCDNLGQIIYAMPLPMFSGFQNINVAQFAAGVYTVFIKRNTGFVATNKLFVEH